MIKAIATFLKVIAKYSSKYVLRQFGVFGLSGTLKKIVKSPNKMRELMKLLGKNVLKKLGKVNFIIDWRKEGFSYALKRLGISMTPMDIKKLYYFLKDEGKAVGDTIRINQNKQKCWNKIQKMDNEKKAKTLNKLVNSKPELKEDKKTKEQLLNHTFWFYVKSPESGNFSVLPQYANITKRTYGVPIRGIIGPMTKYYLYDRLGIQHWNIVKKAMETNDYGREVYSIIRSALPPSRKILIKELYYNNI